MWATAADLGGGRVVSHGRQAGSLAATDHGTSIGLAGFWCLRQLHTQEPHVFRVLRGDDRDRGDLDLVGLRQCRDSPPIFVVTLAVARADWIWRL